jgi:hypothetical protein
MSRKLVRRLLGCSTACRCTLPVLVQVFAKLFTARHSDPIAARAPGFRLLRRGDAPDEPVIKAVDHGASGATEPFRKPIRLGTCRQTTSSMTSWPPVNTFRPGVSAPAPSRIRAENFRLGLRYDVAPRSSIANRMSSGSVLTPSFCRS